MIVKDLRQKNLKELSKIIDDLKAELFMLRFKNSTGQLDQPHKINLIRKDIARVFTVINEKNDNKIISKTKKTKILEEKNSKVKIKEPKTKKSKTSNEKKSNVKTKETKIESLGTSKKEIKKEEKEGK